ncbi:hypothetical protein [Streptoalloteichus hindustanus]|uniref:Excreted virulence factor EspC, type VII ESX diderm n=1 Tax=Streptoalloteichus hindustanus TaxID=2017 RepID=A0A1M5PG61_STRHI|nr:hypothetical protein [Streptoalloteichus hindustanus]SHH00816.1 hypothetical protein SAMN05444320_11851 [Streptoalloteichus hindustanus]
MSGFDVVISALSSAGDAATRAGEQARVVDLAAVLREVTEALPGTRSADTAGKLADFWQTRIKDWSGASAAFGHDLKESARLYADNERAAEHGFSPDPGR